MPRRNPEEEARRTELIALFCLMEDELSGYSLRGRLKEWKINEYLPVSPATIYRSLTRMEEDGLLKFRKVRQGRYPESKVYSITPAGKKRYKELMMQESAFLRSSTSNSMLLGLGAYLSQSQRITLSRKWQDAAREQIESLDRRIKDRESGDTYGKPYAQWLLMDNERHLLRAEVEWLDGYCKMLEDGKA